MAQADLIPFRGIVDMVRAFCTERRTGTVFIVSDDNRMAQVHLDGGHIVALLFRGRHGQEALAGMRTMQAARLRFDDSYLAVDQGEQIDTNAVLDLLGGGAREPAIARAAPAPAPPRGPGVVSTAQAAQLEKLLIQYIGPIGEIVFAEHAARAGNAKALIAVLAGEIPDQAQAAQFIREAGRSAA